MSYAFMAALKRNPQQSYVQLLNSIRDELEGKYDQKPQLSCSHPLDTDLLFVSCFLFLLFVFGFWTWLTSGLLDYVRRCESR